MAKTASTSESVRKQGPRKLLRKLKKVRSAQHKAERKVGKLRLLLEQAESKLAKRSQKLGAVEARLEPVKAVKPAGRAKTAKKPASHQEQQRLEAIGLSTPEQAANGATAGVVLPIAAANGQAATEGPIGTPADADEGATQRAQRAQRKQPSTGEHDAE